MSRSFEDHQVDLAGREPDGKGRSGLADLPETCVASILGFATPRDVARLACVSRDFRDMSSSDQVWQMMLPPHYNDVLARDPNFPLSTCSKKAVFDYLRNGVDLQHGIQKFWLDQCTGGVCICIGARGLTIVWGDDDRYWRWPTLQGSRFSEVAYLQDVCWFAVKGEMRSYLPPGIYTLSWRVLMAPGQSRSSAPYISNVFMWNRRPVKFCLKASGNNDSVDIELYLKEEGEPFDEETQEEQEPLEQTPGFGFVRDTWMEIDVGEFIVETGDSPIELKFSMTEIEDMSWKRGICLDGVVIRPSFVHLKD